MRGKVTFLVMLIIVAGLAYGLGRKHGGKRGQTITIA
jgi:hypothetical protein